jgi:hypothetical protein
MIKESRVVVKSEMERGLVRKPDINNAAGL